MCANYQPVTTRDRLLTFFGVERDRDDVPTEVFPTMGAPFIRKAHAGSGNTRVVEQGAFGLLPEFAKEVAYGRNTYNARSETVATKSSFRSAWRKGFRCIVPADHIYEPRYFGTVEKPGPSERWRIAQPGDVPMGIAGIYWVQGQPKPDMPKFSFAMLTVNADGHPVFSLFHKPGEEKRAVVILDPSQYDEWLTCDVDEAPKFFQLWQGPLDIAAAPLPKRAPRTHSGKVIVPPVPSTGDPETGELF